MTITHDQVRDLNPGDIVRFRINSWPEGLYLEGPLVGVAKGSDYGRGGPALALSEPSGQRYIIRTETGHSWWGEERDLAVVRRVAKAFYINHERDKPVDGDVAVDGEGWVHNFAPALATASTKRRFWTAKIRGGGYWTHGTAEYTQREHGPLRLLVDGATGKVLES